MKHFLSQASVSLTLLAPAGITFFLVLLTVLHTRIPGLDYFAPLVLPMSIFYWALYRRRSLPDAFIIFCGLLQDLLLGAPLGLSSLLGLVFMWGVSAQRRFAYKEGFLPLWLIFSLALLIYCLMQFIAYTIYAGQNVLSSAVIMQWLVSILLYPFVHMLCYSMNHRISLLR